MLLNDRYIICAYVSTHMHLYIPMLLNKCHRKFRSTERWKQNLIDCTYKFRRRRRKKRSNIQANKQKILSDLFRHGIQTNYSWTVPEGLKFSCWFINSVVQDSDVSWFRNGTPQFNAPSSLRLSPTRFH